MKKTTNYNLLKPEKKDFYNVDDFNQNADTIDQELKKIEQSIGSGVTQLPIVTTTGTGAAYLATITGIESLPIGMLITIVPHAVSTVNTPTLNLNGFGAKQIRRHATSNTDTAYPGWSAKWLTASKPITLQYNGEYWMVLNLIQPQATDMAGVVPVRLGGTDKSEWSVNRLIYPTASTTLGQMAIPATDKSLLMQDKSGAPYWGTPENILGDEALKAALDGKEPLIKNAPVKTSLADADTVPLSDSAAANGTKKITIANLKAALKPYFDGFYNKYVHPTYTARSAGLYKTTVDGTGHVSAVAAVQKADITALGIPGQDTVYTHPSWDGWYHIPAGGWAGQMLRNTASGTAAWKDYECMEKIEEITTPASILNLVFTLPAKYEKFEIRGSNMSTESAVAGVYLDFNNPDVGRFAFMKAESTSTTITAQSGVGNLIIGALGSDKRVGFVSRLHINSTSYPSAEIIVNEKNIIRFNTGVYSIEGRPSVVRITSGPNIVLKAGAKFELWGGR